jgi:hypothetical protein
VIGYLNITVMNDVHVNSTTPNPNGCYNIVVRTFLSWNGTGTYAVDTDSFYLVETKTPVLSNSTSGAYASPNNQIGQVIVFPISPVIVRLSFENFCIGQLKFSTIDLYYFDGTYQFYDQIT